MSIEELNGRKKNTHSAINEPETKRGYYYIVVKKNETHKYNLIMSPKGYLQLSLHKKWDL